MNTFVLYLGALLAAECGTLAALLLLPRVAGAYLVDVPGGLKKHAAPVPVLGGCGVLIGLSISLVLIRLLTNFPTGTLHSLRGIMWGGALIFIMGLLDDLKKPQGLPVWIKLLLQFAATGCLIYYGIVIRVFTNAWIAYPLTFLWVVGLTNAFNLLDIVDGLCTTQALIATLGLTLIALPSEFVYVNLAALALTGAGLAFLPFNFSSKHKIFLGDSGSNLLGFLIAALCLGTGYSTISDWGFLAPLFIVGVPLADITFVTLARLLQHKNPLKGSPDHAALRLQANGRTNRYIVSVFALAALMCNGAAFAVTVCPTGWVILLFAAAGLSACLIGKYLLHLEFPHAR